jgi:hypothetical protein
VRRRSAGLWGLVTLVALATASCGDQAVQFDTRYASDFAQANRSTVSVLGVFQDGRLSTEAWKQMGPSLSSSLGGGACEVGFSEELASQKPDLSAAISDVASADGVTDELIDELARAAKGDTVLFVTVSGKVPKAAAPTSSSSGAAPQVAAGGGGRGSRRGGGGGRSSARGQGPRPGGGENDVLEMSASLYSASAHHPLALLELHYTGPSAEDALQKFVAKLGTVVKGARCTGWDWNAPIEEERIRKLMSQ